MPVRMDEAIHPGGQSKKRDFSALFALNLAYPAVNKPLVYFVINFVYLVVKTLAYFATFALIIVHSALQIMH